MSRPDFITPEDIDRWNQIISQDQIALKLTISDLLKEVVYAGLYLAEQLFNSNCPSELITRIQYTAGKMSFGRDPWEVHLLLLQKYYNNELLLEEGTNSPILAN